MNRGLASLTVALLVAIAAVIGPAAALLSPTASAMIPGSTPSVEPSRPPGAATPRKVGWREIRPAGERPPGRENAILALDAARGVLYVHGGRNSSGVLGDLWTVDLAARRWQQLTPPGSKPARRFGHAAVFDARRGRLVIFGGQGSSGFFSDVWAYSPRLGRWVLLAPEGAGPSRRYGTCAGYDQAGDRFLISHGFTSNGRFDDTWAFSFASRKWTDVSPSGPRPVKRCLHVCGWDSATRTFLLFGGQTDGVPQLGDLWLLKDGSWREASPDPSPAARRLPAGAAPGDGRFLVHGGATGASALDDTWVFDVKRGSWRRPAELAGGPGPRYAHAAGADPLLDHVFVFGGSYGGRFHNDLWLLRLPVRK